MSENPFWVVWNPKRGHPTIRHPSREDAVHEAKRLAIAQPGDDFFVLKASCLVRTRQPVEITSFEELPW